MSLFLAFWPIVDDTVPYKDLVDEAADDLARVAAQAHARITGAGRWEVRRSVDVPGSGRVTEHVLTFRAPAVEIDRRSYWRGALPTTPHTEGEAA